MHNFKFNSFFFFFNCDEVSHSEPKAVMNINLRNVVLCISCSL